MVRHISAPRQARRPRYRKPVLLVKQILAWADAEHAQAGRWPTCHGGRVTGTDDESWSAIDLCLRLGLRGLPKGSSLTRLLAEHRGVRNPRALPRLRIRQVLRWADAHHHRCGTWPRVDSGAVPDAPGETWSAIHSALAHGTRGLAGGSSLPRLLAKHRGVRNLMDLPPLSTQQILTWADDHWRRTGRWPSQYSGHVLASPEESWGSINLMLMDGGRTLPGGSSLAQLLTHGRGARNKQRLPRFTILQILAWADAWHQRTGQWPHRASGPIPDAPAETWMAVHVALRQGRRGLPGGASLPKLLARRRGVRNHLDQPALTLKQIQGWARQHRRGQGCWPSTRSGAITAAPGEKWSGVDRALKHGKRGLPDGSSLAQLVAALAGSCRPGEGSNATSLR